MCVGALLESDIEALVYAVANDRDGAAGTVIQLAQHPSLPRRIKVVSGIRRDEAEALFAPLADRLRAVTARSPGRFGILSRGEVSEWLMVPLSKSGVRKHRGFESRPLRHVPPSDGPWPRCRLCSSLTHLGCARSGARLRLARDRHPANVVAPSIRASRRGRLVDYGAALEMRFGATRRGFKSRPLRHAPSRRRFAAAPRWMPRAVRPRVLSPRHRGPWPGDHGRLALHSRSIRAPSRLREARVDLSCLDIGVQARCYDCRSYLPPERPEPDHPHQPARTARPPRRYPSRAVLGGELAVPCTCNPLQQG